MTIYFKNMLKYQLTPLSLLCKTKFYVRDIYVQDIFRKRLLYIFTYAIFLCFWYNFPYLAALSTALDQTI